MIKRVKLGNGVYQVQINRFKSFNYLKLISAQITGDGYFKGVPSVEMILLNDKVMFTSFSNLIPRTNTLNCFDLLLTASNNPTLIHEKFHTLKCKFPENSIDESIEIELMFDIL